MALNKDDFTAEQWAAIMAEADKRADEAANTAYKKAAKSQDTAIQEALNAERERMKMDEQQKLEADRKALLDSQKAFEAERKQFKARTQLAQAGYGDKEIDSLLPLFAHAEDSAVESFIKVAQSMVENKTNEIRKELTNVEPPAAGSISNPTDNATQANELFASANPDDVALGLDLLLQSQGV